MLWVLVSLALSAAASPLEEDIDFQEGKHLIDDLDYERAIFRFQKLAKSERSAEERATVHAWLGLTYANLGDETEAIKTFVIAIKLDPLVVLPPSSPKVAQTFDKARKLARDEMRADSDGDGIMDATDTCPALVESVNGFQDDDGCPDEKPVAAPVVVVDSDGDGVADVDDDCRLVAGEAALKGCPPVAPVAKGAPGVLIGGATAFGLGALGVGVGGLCAVFAQQSQTRALAARFQDDRQTLKGNADNLALGANISFGVGGSVAVGGAVFVVLSILGGEG